MGSMFPLQVILVKNTIQNSLPNLWKTDDKDQDSDLLYEQSRG